MGPAGAQTESCSEFTDKSRRTSLQSGCSLTRGPHWIPSIEIPELNPAVLTGFFAGLGEVIWCSQSLAIFHQEFGWVGGERWLTRAARNSSDDFEYSSTYLVSLWIRHDSPPHRLWTLRSWTLQYSQLVGYSVCDPAHQLEDTPTVAAWQSLSSIHPWYSRQWHLSPINYGLLISSTISDCLKKAKIVANIN